MIALSDPGLPGGTWTSSNPTVATVSSSGVVTDMATSGTSIILHTGVSGTCTMTATYTVTATGNPQPDVCITDLDGPAGNPPYSVTCTPPGPVTVVYELGYSNLPFPAAGFVGGTATIYTVAPTSWPYVVNPTNPVGEPWAIEVLSYSYDGCIWTTPNCWAAREAGEGGRMESPDSTGAMITGETGNIRLVPNPNGGVFTIEGSLNASKDEQQAQVTIINETGQKVYTGIAKIEHGSISKQVSMDPGLPDGIYMISIKSDHDNEVIRFVLDR